MYLPKGYRTDAVYILLRQIIISEIPEGLFNFRRRHRGFQNEREDSGGEQGRLVN